MKIPLKYVELVVPLFLGQRNHQMKLVHGANGLEMEYDREAQEVHIVYGAHAAIIPFTAVASMQPFNPEEAGMSLLPKVATPKPVHAPKHPIKAQVSAPPGIKI